MVSQPIERLRNLEFIIYACWFLLFVYHADFYLHAARITRRWRSGKHNFPLIDMRIYFSLMHVRCKGTFGDHVLFMGVEEQVHADNYTCMEEMEIQ